MKTTTRLRRALSALCASAVLVAASGCAAIPRSGPIGYIDVEGKQGDAAQATPEGPAAGASADQVIRGFLAAGTGTTGDFSVARSFLTDDLSSSWEPTKTVYVLRAGTSLDSVSSEVKSNSQSASVTVPIEASVGSDRMFTKTRGKGNTTLGFRLRQVNGDWRISKAPDAIVVPAASFYTMFQARSLFFFTPDFKMRVPDERWYLRGSRSAPDVVGDLLRGPAGYLRGAVVLPGAGDGVTVQEVSVSDGTAQVTLGGKRPAARKLDQLSDMIARSLLGLGTIQEVSVQSGDYSKELSSGDLPKDTVSVHGNPVAIRDGRLVELAGDSAKPLGGHLASGAQSPAVDYQRQRYAYLGKGRKALHTVRAGSWKDEAVLKGSDLVGPSIDRNGWIFTGERSGSSLIAVKPDGSKKELRSSFLKGRTLKGVHVSRDGSRVAVLSERDGATRLDLLGIKRSGGMVPESLVTGSELDVGRGLSSVVDVSWVGLRGLAVLATTDANDSVLPYSVTLSGVTNGLGAVSDGRYITAGDGDDELRIVTGSGSMYSPNPPHSWDVADNLKVSDPAYPG